VIDEASLFATLSAEVQRTARLAIAAGGPSKQSAELTQRAFGAVGFPMPVDLGHPVFPVVSSLSPAQRAMAVLSCIHELRVWPYALPTPFMTRKQWLGLEPPGVLEATAVAGEPLWRALQLAPDAKAQGAIVDALPLEAALAALTACAGYGVDSGPIILTADLRLLRELEGHGRSWAIDVAERLPFPSARTPMSLLVFLALVRSKTLIERRWERHFPNIAGVADDLLVECARGLPSDRRDAVLCAELSRSLSLDVALMLLDEHPSASVARAMLARPDTKSTEWKSLVAELRKIGRTHEVIKQVVDEVAPPRKAPPKPVKKKKPKRSKKA
jgi:hypothetical protein